MAAEQSTTQQNPRKILVNPSLDEILAHFYGDDSLAGDESTNFKAKRAIINHVLGELRTVDLQESVIPHELARKWFTFGAYDMAARIARKVAEL